MGLDKLICRNKAERARLLDMSRRLRRAEAISLAIFVVANAICALTFGWLAIVPVTVAWGVFWIATTRLKFMRRPELLLAGSWLFTQLMISLGIVLAHGPSLYLLPLFVFPMLLASIVFPPRTAAVGVAITLLLMVATAVVANPQMLHATPFVLIYPAAVTVGASIPAAAVRDLDIQTRNSAVIDPLTSLPGRVALEARAAELAHQSSLHEQEVGVIVTDIDRFKQINDEHGHAHGDQVLRAVGERLTETLGEAETVYRLGGEEFVILVAGSDAATAVGLAERLRAAVEREPLEGQALTMSFGVADSGRGPFEYERVFGAADAALYEAKQQGRNRVQAAPDDWRERDRRREHPVLVEAGAASDPAAAETAQIASGGRWRRRLAEERAESGSWLVEDELQREHVLDLNRRIRESNRPAYAVIFAAVFAAAFTYGWITVVPPLVVAVLYNIAEHRLEKFRRPEYVLSLGWLVAQAGNATGIAFVHFSSADPPVFALVMMLVMVTGSAGVYPRRGALVGTWFAIFATIAAGFAINASLVLHNPGFVALPAALVACAGLIGSAVGRSAVDYRGAAVVDKLTGMLNRAALGVRAVQLGQHSAATGQTVAVIECDLDHFKAINDRHGHSVGDRVLQEVAYRIRKNLRVFDSAYRIGGEEFVILLPGVDAKSATDAAHRIWRTIREEPVGDVPVTMSFGVAGSVDGEPFDYQRVFERADGALYDAKEQGRDRVVVAPTAESARAASTEPGIGAAARAFAEAGG